MNPASCNLRKGSRWFILLLMSVVTGKMVHAAGTRGSDPTGTSESSSAFDTDGDGLADIEDADPDEILVNWARTPESSYLIMDVDAPFAEYGPYDMNDNGEVLFSNGIWSAGTWTPKEASDLDGGYPEGSGGLAGHTFTSSFPGWRYFNNTGNLVGSAEIETTSGQGIGYGFFSAANWISGHTTPNDLGTHTAMLGYHYHQMKLTPMGINAARDTVTILRYQEPSGSNYKLAIFPANGGEPTLIAPPDNGGIRSFAGVDTRVSPSGWIAAQCDIPAGGSGRRLVLWNPSLANVSLPAESESFFHTINLTELPNGRTGLVGNNNSGGHVFLPDDAGDYKYSQSLSSKDLLVMAGDGTGMTSDNKMWINGELIPLGELCPNFDGIVAQGWSLSPLKANKNGTYLIQAEDINGQITAKLLQPVRFNLRNHTDYAKGWDDTADVRTPWTSCGTGKTNSLIGVTIPGCMEEMGNLLELVQHVPEGGDTYVTLENQAIHGVETRFDIKGSKATLANGCQIIVRQKTNHSNRSNALNVHVLPPRVVKFQVYRAFPTENPEPGFVASLDQIKTELNTTYNEQANISFEILQNAIVPVPNITGIFNTEGKLFEANALLLRDRIEESYPSPHLKIILVKHLVPNQVGGKKHVGLADKPGDWAIVETGATTDVYSHESGHALNLTVNANGTGHENADAKAPNGYRPLMYSEQGNTRWIRQEDWMGANAQAASAIYGN